MTVTLLLLPLTAQHYCLLLLNTTAC